MLAKQAYLYQAILKMDKKANIEEVRNIFQNVCDKLEQYTESNTVKCKRDNAKSHIEQRNKMSLYRRIYLYA